MTTGLDLLDLSEPVSQTQTKAKKLEASSKTSSLKKKADGSDLISADAEQRGQALRGSETASLDLSKAIAVFAALIQGHSTDDMKTVGKAVENFMSM